MALPVSATPKLNTSSIFKTPSPTPSPMIPPVKFSRIGTRSFNRALQLGHGFGYRMNPWHFHHGRLVLQAGHLISLFSPIPSAGDNAGVRSGPNSGKPFPFVELNFYGFLFDIPTKVDNLCEVDMRTVSRPMERQRWPGNKDRKRRSRVTKPRQDGHDGGLRWGRESRGPCSD